MGKVAIITGASSGIGAAAATALADRGVDSIVTFNSNLPGIQNLEREIAKKGRKAIPLRLEVGRSETFSGFRESVVAALEREYRIDRFDYLVNNAGVGKMAPFEDTTEAMFEELVQVHLKGPYFLTQALLPLLRDGGAIVNVATMGSITTPGYSAYGAVKGGLSVLTRYMAKEFSKRDIRVNSIAPGPTRTRIANDAFEKYPDIIAPIAAQTALSRLGEPDDIGLVIASLLSDECRWVTAQEIEVSGGFRL